MMARKMRGRRILARIVVRDYMYKGILPSPGPSVLRLPFAGWLIPGRGFPGAASSRKVWGRRGFKSMKLTKTQISRMKDRPYYAVLYAINVLGGRLPENVEEFLRRDPESCLQYAREVIGGRLPDHLHNSMVLGDFGEDRKFVEEYIKQFPERKKNSV